MGELLVVILIMVWKGGERVWKRSVRACGFGTFFLVNANVSAYATKVSMLNGRVFTNKSDESDAD